jgi:26S proteasome regulatory subunit N2
MKILEPYLPQPGTSSPYSEGGSLYALGLIFAGKGSSGPGEVVAYLQNAIQTNQSEVLKHGGALGLGLACMGAGTEAQYSLLSDVLNTMDSAVAGEAAGLGIGLLLLGRLGEPIADSAVRGLHVNLFFAVAESSFLLQITDCLALAHETKHEKVIRGISLGMALIAYGQEENADGLIEQVRGVTTPQTHNTKQVSH